MSRDTVVRLAKANGLRVEITSGPHKLTGDEPTPVGGDSGPSPHDFLAIGLASCTAMTLQMYAKRKEWPLDDVAVTVRIVKSDAATTFEREVKLTGALDDEKRTRLLEIANKCPVHKTLTGKIEIATKLA
jgi:putative redox protein